MKRFYEILARMIPVVLIMVLMAGMSLVIYRRMMERETDASWGSLEMATHDVEKEMNIRFRDNITMLDLAADAVIMKADLNRHDTVREYIATVQSKTIFERIDMMFPDGQILLQSGEYTTDKDKLSYADLLKKGAHLSTRRDDPVTGRPVIYYFAPVVTDGLPEAILIGVIDCGRLSELFVSEHYSSEAEIFLIDRRDGSYLLDKWHPTLGNIRDLGDRERPEEYKDVDFISEIMDGENSAVAFVSRTTGKMSYMTYMPVSDLPFSVCLFVQEDRALQSVYTLQRLLIHAAMGGLVILAVYLVWNILIVTASMRNRARARAAELEQEKNAAKSRFLSSVSHDIRTPLNGIVGMLDVIRMRGEVPEHLEDPLHKIDVSAKYLLTLANDVLDMNELETGKIVFDHEPIDLVRLSEDIGILMAPRARDSGITYRMDCTALTHPHVLGSEVHINKILLNLIGNAIKYNREGGTVLVTVDETDVRDGRGLYCFTVADSGIGMSEEFQKTMFNAFEQESAGARTGQMGHGLGLSIVRRLVDRMGGTITVDSHKDMGTTVSVTLPLSVSAEAADSETEEVTATNLVGVHILLAEDNALNTEIAETILSASGAFVTHAADGRQALELFRASAPGTFSVILMDLMMPEMDGYEATRAIRALPRPDARTVPIIAMTASTFSEDIRRCREAGMNEHIGKPLDMNTVILKVAKHLKKN